MRASDRAKEQRLPNTFNRSFVEASLLMGASNGCLRLRGGNEHQNRLFLLPLLATIIATAATTAQKNLPLDKRVPAPSSLTNWSIRSSSKYSSRNSSSRYSSRKSSSSSQGLWNAANNAKLKIGQGRDHRGRARVRQCTH